MQVKLFSDKDTLIGLISFPSTWGYYLRENGSVTFPVSPRLEPVGFGLADSVPLIEIRHGALYQNGYGGVILCGISIEEFETLPGCSFSPSMAYLRSIVEDLA